MTAGTYIKRHTKPSGEVTLMVNTAERYDPTRTTALRNKYAREMGKRFRELRGEIYRAIVQQDVFGLRNNQMGEPVVIHAQRGQFAFTRTQDKVAAFMEWLKTRQERGILEIVPGQQIGTAIDNSWQNLYLQDSYKRGVIRSRYELSKAGYPVQSLEQSGGIDAVLGGPTHVDRMGVVYTRAFNQLQGITDQMDMQISNVLAQGLADGDHPRLLARKINATIKGGGADLGITDTLGRFIPAERRAKMLARTEVIRAHHMANVQEMENWAVENVKVKVEWRTAGHNVCEICQALEGREFTLAEIRTMIPRHPHCRCMALPVDYSET